MSRKRSREERIEYYEEKLRKIKRKCDQDRRNQNDSPDVEINEDTNILDNEHDREIMPDEILVNIDQDVSHSQDNNQVEVSNCTIPSTSIEISTEALPALAPEFLLALGDSVEESPTYGEDIHHNLPPIWLPIIRKGIAKDLKEKLLTEFTIPNNCKLLRAPTLNLEISAALTDSMKHRDKKLEAMQQQLGLGVSAISKAMSVLLTSDDKLEAIKLMSDSCRLLNDLHFLQTEHRIKLITPSLDKSVINVIEKEERDETLFGLSLNEKIKAAKAIERQGIQIRKPVTTIKTQPRVASSSRQGNWSGPHRFPTKGRGGGPSGYKQTSSVQTRRAPAPTRTSRPVPPAAQTSRYQRVQRRN